MLRLVFSKPCRIHGHIVFKRDPAWFGIGHYEDNRGAMWDVWGIIGKTVIARPIDDHPHYSTTGELRNYEITWMPYSFEAEAPE